jgi:hypothetical protein
MDAIFFCKKNADLWSEILHEKNNDGFSLSPYVVHFLSKAEINWRFLLIPPTLLAVSI